MTSRSLEIEMMILLLLLNQSCRLGMRTRYGRTRDGKRSAWTTPIGKMYVHCLVRNLHGNECDRGRVEVGRTMSECHRSRSPLCALNVGDSRSSCQYSLEWRRCAIQKRNMQAFVQQNETVSVLRQFVIQECPTQPCL
jgi:hypothetical protein